MMSSCLSASRGYKARLGNNSCVKGLSSSQTTTITTSTVISDTKSNLSSSETTSSLLVLRKKPRTRRRRPQEIYNEAAAALSAVYPKVFCPPKEKLALRKKAETLSSENDDKLLHEVPTLIRRARGMEEIELLYNEGGGGIGDSEFGDSHSQVPNLPMAKDSPGSSESKSQVMSPCHSPSADDFESSEIDYDYSFLDSNEERLDASVMSSIMGCSPNPDFQEENFCCYGIHQYHQELDDDRLQYSAIRSLRRNQDFIVPPAFDYSFPRFRFSERAKERNGLSSSSSLGWLKGEDAPQRLKLKLNYDDVLNAWSDKGPAYTDDIPHSQIGLVDSSLGSMVAGFNYDFIPDLSFWRGLDENGMYDQMEDRYVFGEDGLFVSSGVREASVLRYKEKRRTRLFSKKIRYEVRKLNAERRPRMKGRFVRRLSDL